MLWLALSPTTCVSYLVNVRLALEDLPNEDRSAFGYWTYHPVSSRKPISERISR